MNEYKSIDISSIVRIDDWDFLDLTERGTRAKRTVVNPDTEEYYIFKEPKRGREAQIWSELLASYIAGDLLGWEVQQSQIALHGDKIGNLLKFIYDPKRYTGDNESKTFDRFEYGEGLCKEVDSQYDEKEGKRHNWDLLLRISQAQPQPIDIRNANKLYNEEFFNWWAKAIAFDTLISNTDRHAENWAIIITPTQNARMAPLFDNASSMGCEVDEIGLRRWFGAKGQLIDSKVESYVRRGYHHLRNGEVRFNFEELARKVLNEHPDTRPFFEAIASLDLSPIVLVFDAVDRMDDVPEHARLSNNRKAQIMRILEEGKARIDRCLA